MAARRAHWDGETRQVISFVNALPEDYVGPDEAARLCWEGNEELVAMRRADHVVFGTDAPLGILPAGATAEIRAAIDAMDLSTAEREAIYATNYRQLVS